MLSHILITFLYVLKSTLADVQLVSPASGASIAGGAVTLKWQDSGAKPALVAIKAADIILCTGTNAAPQLLDTVAAAVPLGSTTSLAVTIPLTIGATGQYFFKFVSTTAGGQVVTTFSNRFTLTGMTGTVVANTGLAAVGPAGTTPPAALTETAAATAVDTAKATTLKTTTATNGNNANPKYASYALQVGPTRQAPPQIKPGTRITANAKNAGPMYATSAYTIFTTAAGKPDAVTTITQVATWTATKYVNAAPVHQFVANAHD